MSDQLQRWYKGFHGFGRPEALIEKISAAVRNLDVGDFIPVVRVQRRAHGEFYFFVGIQSEEVGKPPSEAERFLALPFLGHALPTPFTLADIKGMVGGEMDVHDYGSRIPYRPPRDFDLGDPFDTSDADDEGAMSRDELVLHLDRLLLWMSAVGTGSWTSFQNACNALGIEDERHRQSQRIMRSLRILGHAETSQDGSRWSVAPTVLARTGSSGPGAPGVYVLCGARDQGLLTSLSSQGTLEVVPQAQRLAPQMIRVTTAGTEPVRGLLSDVHYADEVAKQLANVLPAMDQWIDWLAPLPNLSPHRYDCKRFDGSEFVDEPFRGQTGFYELWPAANNTERRRGRPTYRAFYESSRQRWVRGDWYGLRFLAHYYSTHACPVEFDDQRGRLAIPASWRWPELYERCLVLASGSLPVAASSRDWLIYEEISAELFMVLSHKLALSE